MNEFVEVVSKRDLVVQIHYWARTPCASTPPAASVRRRRASTRGCGRGRCPPMHAAPMTRHRGICAERKAYPRRRGAERHYALDILGDGSLVGVQRFRRLCEQGYRLYTQGAG